MRHLIPAVAYPERSFGLLALILIILLILSPAASFAEEGRSAQISEKPPLFLHLGEQRLVRVPGMLRYSSGSEVIRIRPLPPNLQKKPAKDLLLIKAVKSGDGDLWVWKTDGSAEKRRVTVLKRSNRKTSTALLEALSSLEEVETYFLGDTALLRGRVDSEAEASRIGVLRNSFEGQIVDETFASDELTEKGLRLLELWRAQSPWAEILSIEKRPGGITLSGEVPKKETRQRISRKATAIFPLVRLELEELNQSRRPIFFKVFLLELKKSVFRKLGIDWSGEVLNAFRITPWKLNSQLSLDLTLHALETDGAVRILSRPELVVRAPGEAELFAGGEIPIRTRSLRLSSVSWKSYGLTLKLKVSQANSKLVRLDIETEVSSLDLASGAEEIPGIKANRMKTQVDARFNRPLLLSGLLQEQDREQIRGLPGFKNIPVLGALFGSEDYLSERSELVAILLPLKAPPEPDPSTFGDAFGLGFPKGAVPPPRNWLSHEEELKLSRDENFPWNALN